MTEFLLAEKTFQVRNGVTETAIMATPDDGGMSRFVGRGDFAAALRNFEDRMANWICPHRVVSVALAPDCEGLLVEVAPA